MTNRLEERLKEASRGNLGAMLDEHEKLHRDSLTALLRMKEELEANATFIAFLTGFVGSINPKETPQLAEAIAPIERRLRSFRLDAERGQPQKKGCGGC